jgi:hypothetical protein
MRWMESLIAASMLALLGCAADADPGTDPEAEAAPRALVPAPLSRAEVATYEQEMAKVFHTRPDVAARASLAGGRVAEVDGHANVALIKVDEDGQLVTTCADSPAQAMQFLTATAAPLEVK